MERVPSLFHVQSSHTRSKRPLCSQKTGYTPEKKKPKQQDKVRSAWSEAAQAALLFALDNRTPGISDSDFWNYVSDHVYDQSSVFKTADACRVFARRKFMSKVLAAEQCEINSSSISQTKTSGFEGVTQLQTCASTQTDISVSAKCPIQQHSTIPTIYLSSNGSPSAAVIQQTLLKPDADSKLTLEETNKMTAAIMKGCTSDIADAIWEVPSIKEAVTTKIKKEIESNASCLSKHPSKARLDQCSSCLFQNSVTDLTEFDYYSIVKEFSEKQNLLFQFILSLTIPSAETSNIEMLERSVRRIAAAYGILMQFRQKDMSLFQRLVTCILESEHTHQKVYDALQPLGISLGHSGMLHLVTSFKGHYNNQLIDSIKAGRRLRLVGDNVDVLMGVKHERKGRHQHLQHWFGSLALTDVPHFHALNAVQPQAHLPSLPFQMFLLNETDVQLLMRNFAVHIGRIAAKHMPELSFLHKVMPVHIEGPWSGHLAAKTEVIPLEVLPYNESYNADCIKILNYYQDLIKTIHAGSSDSLNRIHIGGDQKTREKFSMAKRNLAASITPEERCDNLGPITFEVFHLKMKLLGVIFHLLFKEESDNLGLMETEATAISRNSVNDDAKGNYAANREFFSHFFESYMLVALCEFFQMDTLRCMPKNNFPANIEHLTEEEKQAWFWDTFSKFLQWLQIDEIEYGPRKMTLPVTEQQAYQLPDGQIAIHVKRSRVQVEDDKLFYYAHNVIELGLLFAELDDCARIPDRARFLALIKYLMVVLRGENTKAKYNLELLRLLFHQLATLSEKEAHESLYSLFVNTQGGIDGHVPADLVMEHHVGIVKKTIQAMGCNKTKPEAIQKRTAAIPAFKKIEDNYCKVTQTLTRAQKPKVPSAQKDIHSMYEHIRLLKPFYYQAGRALNKFKNIKFSLLAMVNYDKMAAWIKKNQRKYTNELGQ